MTLITAMNVPPPSPSSSPTQMNPMMQINPATNRKIPVGVVISEAKMSNNPHPTKYGDKTPDMVIKSLQINEKKPPTNKIPITLAINKT